MKALDEDGDGCISYSEFLRFRVVDTSVKSQQQQSITART